MKNKILAASFACFAALSANATDFGIYDGDYSFFNGASQITTGSYEVRWGTFAAGVFTPIGGLSSTSVNAGYNDLSSPEIIAQLSLGNNTLIAAGTQLSLNLTLLADDAAYVASANEVILTDSTWVAPTFQLSGPRTDVVFTANTTALKGNYSYNGGNEIFSTVPEPSTFAALAGVSVLGLAALRRRRA